jgi:hypothetical protein
MRLEKLNRIVGEAVVNCEFRTRLLADPRAAVAGFDLAADELDLIGNVHAESVDQLARHLVSALSLDDRSPVAVPARSSSRFQSQPAAACRVRGDHTSALKTTSPLIRAYMSPEP